MSSPLLLNRGGVLRRGFVKGSDLALIPSSTPPDNPSAGDLWLLPSGYNGGLWLFTYDTTETSAYKWKFIGGPPAQIVVDTFETTTSAWGTTADLATVGPTFTCTRAGDYAYNFTARVNNNTANVGCVTMVKWGTGFASNDTGTAVTTSSTASADECAAEQGIATALPAGQSIKMVYATLSSGTGRWGQRRLWVTPIRVA